MDETSPPTAIPSTTKLTGAFAMAHDETDVQDSRDSRGPMCHPCTKCIRCTFRKKAVKRGNEKLLYETGRHITEADVVSTRES